MNKSELGKNIYDTSHITGEFLFPEADGTVIRDIYSQVLRPKDDQPAMSSFLQTDVSPLTITKQMLDKIELPELITDKIGSLEKKYKLSKELASQIVKQNIDFEHYVDPFEAYKYLFHLTEISELVSGSLLLPS